MIWFDQFRERVIAERLVTATIAVAGGKGSDGKDIQVTDVDRELVEFDKRLARPLNFEAQRAALLKEVSQ